MSKVRPKTFDAQAAAAARAVAGLTQQQVADAVGRTKALVQHWESGRRQPYPEATRTLAALYGVPVRGLLTSALDLSTADLAGIRDAQRITVADLAVRMGVSRRTIERVEAGSLMPDDPYQWAIGYNVSLPALATAWRNSPLPPPPPSAAASGWSDDQAGDAGPDHAPDDLGMVRRRAGISGEQMAQRVMGAEEHAPKVRELYRVEATIHLPPDPVRWAAAYGLSAPGFAACWRRGWIGPHGGAGKHPPTRG